MNSPTMVSTPVNCSGRPETIVPKTTSRRSVSLLSTTAQAKSTAVLRVRPSRPAHCRSRAVSASGNSSSVLSGTPSPAATVPSATISGPDTPRRYSSHLASAAALSCPATREGPNLTTQPGGRYDRARGADLRFDAGPKAAGPRPEEFAIYRGSLQVRRGAQSDGWCVVTVRRRHQGISQATHKASDTIKHE